jgi:exodeoxyribonuclease V gamma subunit
MLNLYQSNSLDALAKLWRATRRPEADPLLPETVLVPSKGMQRWLALWLAGESGIAANLDFQLPAAFVWRLIRLAMPAVTRRSDFDPELLAWRALRALPAIMEQYPEASIAPSWRQADAAGRYQLAWRVADVFDQYLIYRPDWVSAWEAGARRALGPDEAWQASLWEQLANGASHRGRLLKTLEKRLRQGNLQGLPTRICLFGIGSLPPSYWELVQMLGERLEVDCFLLNPSREYWGQLQKGGEGQHALLAALGQQGRDFINQVASSGVVEPVGSQAFVQSQQPTLLAALQNDLVDQRVRQPEERIEWSATDDSLGIQVCHSALREVEVLHDRLVHMFQTDPDLQAHEVLVMVSDIQRYAPLVDAVFGTRRQPALPYTIADRKLELEEPLLARFFELLAMPGSRFELPRVLGLLEEPALCACFDLDTNDVELIRRWCEEAHIRWGRDSADRRRRGLDDSPISWRAGLDRLLLGFMLPPGLAPGDDSRMEGMAPLDSVGAVGQARVLARFSSLVEALLHWERRLQTPRTLTGWADQLGRLLQAFFVDTPESGAALQHLREVLAELREQARLVNDDEAHEFAVLRAWLQRQVQGLEARRGFLHGAVTVCAMVPMRSLPFKVIAVLGMDDGVFPRHQRPWHFDLMALHPRAGDRSRRLDDRYLFLETLLAAREKLYLSYSGRSDLDDSLRAPSPVLLELLDQVVETAVCADPTLTMREALTTVHALQPFHPQYFSGDPQFPSYVRRFFAASQALARGKKAPLPPSVFTQLPEPEPEWFSLTLIQLERFLQHPVRFLLRDRLRIRLEQDDGVLESSEPVYADRNSRALRTRLLPMAQVNAGIFRAESLIPAGAWGERLLYAEAAVVAPLREPVLAAQAAMLPPLTFKFAMGAYTLEGALTTIEPEGLVRWSLHDRIFSSDILLLWLHHLILCKLKPTGVALQSRLLGLGGDVVLEPVANPDLHLQAMLDAYGAGLRAPLPLFRRASPVLIKSEGDADKTWAAYAGNDYASGDASDIWVDLVWQGQNPLQGDFELWSQRIYGPLKEWLP